MYKRIHYKLLQLIKKHFPQFFLPKMRQQKNPVLIS